MIDRKYIDTVRARIVHLRSEAQHLAHRDPVAAKQVVEQADALTTRVTQLEHEFNAQNRH
jgi:hypothetical protein